jgi:hypothetical protein
MRFQPPQTPPLVTPAPADVRARLHRLLVGDDGQRRALTEAEMALLAVLASEGPPPWVLTAARSEDIATTLWGSPACVGLPSLLASDLIDAGVLEYGGSDRRHIRLLLARSA